MSHWDATEPTTGARRAAAEPPGTGRVGPRAANVLVGVLAVVLPVALFIPLAVQAWNNEVASWDFRLSDWIHAYENRETVLDTWPRPLETVLSFRVQVLGFLLVAAVTLAIAVRGNRRLALFVGAGIVGATILGPVLKELIGRPPVDPSGDGGGDYSFPSGHALRSMAAGGAIAAVAWSSRWRWPVAIVCGLAVLVIGVAVVYHEWHWVSDVLAGWCIAIAWLGCVWLLLRPRDPRVREPGPRRGEVRSSEASV